MNVRWFHSGGKARLFPISLVLMVTMSFARLASGAELPASGGTSPLQTAPATSVGDRFLTRFPPATPPALAMVCSPVGAIADRIGQLSALTPGVSDAIARLANDNPLLTLMTREGMLDAGLNPEGEFSLAFRQADHQKTMTLALPFSGNELKAHAFLAEKVAPEQDLEAEIGGWRIRGKKGDSFASLENGILTMTTTEALPDAASASPTSPAQKEEAPPLERAMTEALPVGEGCILFADFKQFSQQEEPQPRMLFFVPLGSTQHYSLRAHLPPELTTVSLGSADARPVLGKSLTPPLLLVSVNAPLLELLRQPGLPPNITPPPELLKELDRKVRVPGGSSLAVFGDMNLLMKRDFSAAGVIAAIPLRQASGLPVTGRGLRRTLEKTLKKSDKGTVERLSARRLKVVSSDEQKSTLYLESRWNRLWIASSESLLEEALGKKGNSWGSPSYLEASNRWPVQLAMTLPQGDQQQIELISGIELTLQNLRIDLDAGPGQAGNTFLMAALAAVAIPNFQSMQLKAKRSELLVTVSSIAAAEEAYAIEQGEALALSAAPRSMADLNTDAVDWRTPSDWLPLDLQLHGTFRGIYWVEVTPDRKGYTVHGMADLDGDGMVSHVKLERGQAAVLITPANVY